MIVRSIALDFFRNYVHLDARFSPEVNVIYGENAQGKTNLLEAVAICPPPPPTGLGTTGSSSSSAWTMLL